MKSTYEQLLVWFNGHFIRVWANIYGAFKTHNFKSKYMHKEVQRLYCRKQQELLTTIASAWHKVTLPCNPEELQFCNSMVKFLKFKGNSTNFCSVNWYKIGIKLVNWYKIPFGYFNTIPWLTMSLLHGNVKRSFQKATLHSVIILNL